MARPRSSNRHGAVSEPEQRELEQFLGQHHQQHQHIRRFEILKSTPVGLVFPQNLQLEVRDVDSGILATGLSTDLSSKGGPAFVTSEMKWWKEKYMLPPSFEIFPSNPDDESHLQPTQQSCEITGLPPSPSHDTINKSRKSKKNGSSAQTKPWPLAQIKYPGWQGVSQMTIAMTIYHLSQLACYEHTLHSPHDIRSRWTIARQGWARTYNLACVPSTPEVPRLRWRGSKKILDLPELDDGHPRANGNLKLEDASNDNRLVAVYKQRRDWDVMGSLTVFSDNLKDTVPIEVVVASCLAVVMYERIGWQNMFGS